MKEMELLANSATLLVITVMMTIGMVEKRLWVYMGRQVSPSFMRKWLLNCAWRGGVISPAEKEGMRVVQAVEGHVQNPGARRVWH